MREILVTPTGPDGIKVRAALVEGVNQDHVVHIPAFGGNHRAAIAHGASRVFSQKYGVSFVTIDPFVMMAGFRSLSEPGLTLDTHIADLKLVLIYLREKMRVGHENVHVIGHSIGAYTAVKAGADPELDLASVILWDGSHPYEPSLRKAGNWEPLSNDRYYSTWGMGAVVAGSYLRSVQEFHLADYTFGWDTPTLVVAAEQGILCPAADIYHQELRPSEQAVIGGSNHHFMNDDEWFDSLCDVTGDWISGGYLEA